MNRRRLFVAAGVLLPAVAVLTLLARGFTREPRYIESPMLGRPAPAFALTLFDGSSFRLENLRGKVIFLNFWASWCPPCRAEAPTLETMWRQLKSQDVVFLGANTQDEEPRRRRSWTSSASRIRMDATPAAASPLTTGCGDCQRRSSSTARAALPTSTSARWGPRFWRQRSTRRAEAS